MAATRGASKTAIALMLLVVLGLAPTGAQTLETRVQELEAQNAQLRQLVEELQSRLSALEIKSTPGAEAAQPGGEMPDLDDLLSVQPAAGQAAGATGDPGGDPSQNPLISFTADFLANAWNRQPAAYSAGENLRKRLLGLRSMELTAKRGVSAYGDGFVVYGDHGHGPELEEGYIDVNRAVDRFNFRLGRWRVPFGPYNGVHEHQLPSVNYPRSLVNFFGDEGLSGDGVEVTYLPETAYYTEIRLGAYRRLGGHEEHEHEEALQEDEEEDNPFSYSVRVRYNRQLDPRNDLDFTATYLNRGGHEAGEGDEALSLGLQWRNDRGNQRSDRVILDWTNYWRDTADGALHRNGWGVCYLKQMGLYQDVGAQYEDAAFGDPGLTGRVRAVSAWYTYKAQETQWYRMQFRHTNYPEGPDSNELLLQSIWSIGSHSHEFN